MEVLVAPWDKGRGRLAALAATSVRAADGTDCPGGRSASADIPTSSGEGCPVRGSASADTQTKSSKGGKPAGFTRQVRP